MYYLYVALFRANDLRAAAAVVARIAAPPPFLGRNLYNSTDAFFC